MGYMKRAARLTAPEPSESGVTASEFEQGRNATAGAEQAPADGPAERAEGATARTRDPNYRRSVWSSRTTRSCPSTSLLILY
jgi:hypothetical protein